MGESRFDSTVVSLAPPAIRFGLDDAYGLPASEQNVVGRSDVGLVFAHRDPKPRAEVERVFVLYMPTSFPEAVVDPVSGDLLRGLIHGPGHALALSRAAPMSLFSFSARLMAQRAIIGLQTG